MKFKAERRAKADAKRYPHGKRKKRPASPASGPAWKDWAMQMYRAERDAQRALGLRMIQIGWKALAAQIHPDKGGTHELMLRLNAERAHLKKYA